MALDPLDDPLRLSEVARCLRSPAIGRGDLQDVLREASAVAGAPMATLNLVDADTQHQAVTAGFPGARSPRSESMCARSMQIGGFVHVPDASLDPRFSSSPWVDGRRADVRFYAAAPLVTEQGVVLGTLCVFDVVPHHLDEQQVQRLRLLAQQATELLLPAAV